MPYKRQSTKKQPRVREMRYFDYEIDAMKRENELFPVISFWLGFWKTADINRQGTQHE